MSLERHEKANVLYVDDESENLTVFKFAFRKNYTIFLAESAREGLEILRNNEIQIVITDQRMPEITGVEFLEDAAQEFPQIIRMILTGYSDMEAIIQAINKGQVYRYITKPWDKDELRVSIDNALEAYHLKIQNKQLIQSLKESNIKLEEANQKLEAKVKERTSQVIEQKEEIEEKNKELEHHRNHLEILVTERTRDLEIAKEKAEKADRLKTAFLANMSHEIRTPMNAVIGFADMLEQPDLTEDDRAEFVKHINDSGMSLLNLIDNIIDIAKIDSEQIVLRIATFDAIPVLREVKNHTVNECEILQKNNIDVALNTTFPELLLNADIGRFRQVLLNLVDNAVKFTEEGVIEIGCEFDVLNNDSAVRFYVKDSGIGIPENSVDEVFNRFRKIDTSQVKLYRGAGLGLAISESIVKLMNGKMGVHSVMGVGSEFFFILPYNAG